jgi:hypothetical protein
VLLPNFTKVENVVGRAMSSETDPVIVATFVAVVFPPEPTRDAMAAATLLAFAASKSSVPFQPSSSFGSSLTANDGTAKRVPVATHAAGIDVLLQPFPVHVG